jgi:hypothetical protein
MEKTTFQYWTRAKIEKIFGIEQVSKQHDLVNWLEQAHFCSINEIENYNLEFLKESINELGDLWNEAELREYFIGPLLAFVNFNTKQFHSFCERSISGTIGDYEISGKPDALVAKGRWEPEIPYFCLHEYKKETDPDGDAIGQVLIAMLVAQTLNTTSEPIYGICVKGKTWYFIVLQDKQYCISKSFSADDEEIFDIYKILKALKDIILSKV